MNILNSITLDDKDIPVKRLRIRRSSSGARLTEVVSSKPFLRGPIPMDWLNSAARLPGKALNVALAIRWLDGMNGGQPIKLTAKALNFFHVSQDACRDGLTRLEKAGLVSVTRKPGQRPTVLVRQPAVLPQSRPAQHQTSTLSDPSGPNLLH